jgi:hypothetical protein
MIAYFALTLLIVTCLVTASLGAVPLKAIKGPVKVGNFKMSPIGIGTWVVSA